VPPLRERRDDVDALVHHLVGLFGERFEVDRRISPAAMQVIHRYSWPGNVRELVNAIEGAMIVCDGPEIQPHHLPRVLHSGAPEGWAGSAGEADDSSLASLAELQKAHIARVLAHTGGRRKEAAEILGISERNLYRKLAAYDAGILSEDTQDRSD